MTIRTPRSFTRCFILAFMTCVSISTVAHAQILVANDDGEGVPFDLDLDVEEPGVLENDTMDGESASEGGATAELVSDVIDGTLTLNADGSFIYSPDVTFTGSDTFTYRIIFDTAVSAPATVTLTACVGGPQIFSCWKESSYFEKATELGFGGYAEGFEDDAAWGSAREPTTAASVLSAGTIWQTNHPNPPASNRITTGNGPAQTGLYGVYDSDHGYATALLSECLTTPLPPECLFYDGFTGIRQSGQGIFHGVGGFFTGTSGANVAVVLDGALQVDLGRLPDPNFYFLGVIDAGMSGFTTFQFRELDGKVGQERRIFADDFTILTDTFVPVPALSTVGLVALGCLLPILGTWRATGRERTPQSGHD
jgi:hypothetical protein